MSEVKIAVPKKGTSTTQDSFLSVGSVACASGEKNGGKQRACAGVATAPEAEASHFQVASRIFERLRGMKGVKEDGLSMVLVPCCDIHTFGMKKPIDVAFVDETGTVVAVHRKVTPRRRVRNAAARLVVERFARQGAWFECGDAFFGVPPRSSPSTHKKKNGELCFERRE